MRRALTCLVLAVGLLVATTACEDDVTAEALLSEEVLFGLGEHELTPDTHNQLVAFADRVRGAGGVGRIFIAGHTDDQGDESYNQSLSERRAATVEEELTRLLADTAVTFQSEGYGDTDPVVPNDSTGNRELNRRVEITFWQ